MLMLKGFKFGFLKPVFKYNYIECVKRENDVCGKAPPEIIVVAVLHYYSLPCLGIQMIQEKNGQRRGKKAMRLCVSSAVYCCCCCKIGKYVNKNDDIDEVLCVDLQLN